MHLAAGFEGTMTAYGITGFICGPPCVVLVKHLKFRIEGRQVIWKEKIWVWEPMIGSFRKAKVQTPSHMKKSQSE